MSADPTGVLDFTWLTDTHVQDSAVTTIDGGIASAVADVSDALIHTGDMGDNYTRRVSRALSLCRDGLTKPFLWCVGNHDEYEATVGQTNTSDIAALLGQPAPFWHSVTMEKGELRARILSLDCNLYDAYDGSRLAPAHATGDRIGYYASAPRGGEYRRFGAEQIAWVRETLAADRASNLIIILVHYPPAGVGPTDWTALADVFHEDYRPTILLCGHVHGDARIYTLISSKGQRYPAYKAPATLESGCYTHLRVWIEQGQAQISAEVRHFTQPGGWIINPPFTTT